MMLIGKHYNESTIYRAAHAFEQIGRLAQVVIDSHGRTNAAFWPKGLKTGP